MKTHLIILLSLLALSCSKKVEIDPDLTKEFIGLWKTEVQKSARDDVWTTYEIKRISDNLVNIDVKQYFDDHLGEYEDFADEYSFDSVKVASDGSLKIIDSRMYGLNKITYDGNGVLAGDTLTFNLIIDYDDQNYNTLFVIPCTRQK